MYARVVTMRNKECVLVTASIGHAVPQTPQNCSSSSAGGELSRTAQGGQEMPTGACNAAGSSDLCRKLWTARGNKPGRERQFSVQAIE
jgi:hypothetical protein